MVFFVCRPKLADFLFRLVQPNGSFVMHEGGEADIRGAYCAASVARITKLAIQPLFSDTPKWIARFEKS